MKRVTLFLLAFLLLCAGTACADPEPVGEPMASPHELIASAVELYGSFGDAKDAEVDGLLDALESLYPDTGARWREIFACWRRLDAGSYGPYLPEGLPDDGSLCIVVLGYQLEPDGGMRPELRDRTEVALACAKQYPHAYILCTGGHTACDAPRASEADVMADWLIARGVPSAQVIREADSLTTTQNAEFTYALLTEAYPSVTAVAVVSSDYHVVSGAVLLEAVSILNAPAPGEAAFHVVACAACTARTGNGRTFAVSGLKALSRN